jgi:hypothetical protein
MLAIHPELVEHVQISASLPVLEQAKRKVGPKVFVACTNYGLGARYSGAPREASVELGSGRERRACLVCLNFRQSRANAAGVEVTTVCVSPPTRGGENERDCAAESRSQGAREQYIPRPELANKWFPWF